MERAPTAAQSALACDRVPFTPSGSGHREAPVFGATTHGETIVTEQPQTKPEDKHAEALMDRAAGNLRSHMNTALANLSRHRELLDNLAGAGLLTLPAPTEQPGPRSPRDAAAARTVTVPEN